MFIGDLFNKKLNEDGSDAKSYMQTDRGAVPPKTATDKPMDSKPAQEPKTKKDPKDYLIKNEQVQQYNPKGVPINTAQAAPAPLNVPKGWEAKTQADGSTRISKQGSMSSVEYKQNMADYKAKNWTPEKMADYGQRMASGQGYTDAERSANYQQQQKSFGQYADTPLDEQGMAEGRADPTGSWVVYDGSKVKRFKSRDGAKAYAEKNGGKVASSEHYADKIQGKQGVAEGGESYLKDYDPMKSQMDPKTGQSYLKDYDPMKSQMDPSGKSYFDTGVDEGFDDLDRFMKDKYGPKPSGGSGIKHGTYGQPGRQRGRKKGELSGAFHQGGGSDVPHNVDFDRSHSERSAGRRMPRFSDDYDSVKRSEVDEGSVQDKLHKRHQELRKKRGAPDPEYYQELKKTFDLPDDERQARTAELKQKYKITNEDRERYIEALGRAGYEIVNERRMTCPECGGAAYEDRMLAEKQDACYHKVKSRYKVWPSAYASGALVRCRKKGAANWGNKSKK